MQTSNTTNTLNYSKLDFNLLYLDYSESHFNVINGYSHKLVSGSKNM
jgi:hypothetical protein